MGNILYDSRKKVWKAIREQKAETGKLKQFDSVTIAKKAKVGLPRANSYIRLLHKAKILKCLNEDAHKNIRRVFILAKDVGNFPPDLSKTGEVKPLSLRQKTWLAIKVLKVFTVKDVTLATGENRDNTGKYLTLLEKAGYIRAVYKGKGFSGESRFTFIASKDTGPHAPILQMNKNLYDCNTGKVVWTRGAA